MFYQLVFHIYQWKALSQDQSVLGGDETYGACAAAPGAKGASSLCMEAQLFKGWHELPEESAEGLDQLLAISPRRHSPEQSANASSPPGSSLRASTPVALDPVAVDVPPANLEQRSMRGTVKAVEEKHLAKSLPELQQKLEAKMRSQARRHAEHRALQALHASQRKSAEISQADEEEQDEMTAWAHNLDHLTHDLQDHMKVRRTARAELAARAEQLGLKKPSHPAAERANEAHPLLDEIQSLGQQLCQDPAHRSSAACKQFSQADNFSSMVHDSHKAHEQRQANAMAHMKLLEQHMEELHKEQQHDSEALQEKSMEFLKDLCSDPARSSYPACTRFSSSTKSSSGSFLAPAAPAAAESVQKAADATALHGQPHTPQMILHRPELRDFHWDGRIPKVACITVLPQGHATEILMKYFMDNYHLQHYEGERQLIIVYHSDDREASRIAHQYANGTSVIAAAARGTEDFPSATAYRYGAWLGRGADLVARWDFDAWHHPNRLSMQVRAINLVQRPVSVVSRITAFDAEEKQFTMVGGTGSRGSLIGKVAWMQKHWMPLLEEESAMAVGLYAHQVVQVEMPELIAYHDVANSGLPVAL